MLYIMITVTENNGINKFLIKELASVAIVEKLFISIKVEKAFNTVIIIAVFKFLSLLLIGNTSQVLPIIPYIGIIVNVSQYIL